MKGLDQLVMYRGIDREGVHCVIKPSSKYKIICELLLTFNICVMLALIGSPQLWFSGTMSNAINFKSGNKILWSISFETLNFKLQHRWTLLRIIKYISGAKLITYYQSYNQDVVKELLQRFRVKKCYAWLPGGSCVQDAWTLLQNIFLFKKH